MPLVKVVMKERFDDGMWELRTYLVEAATKAEAEAKLGAHRAPAGGVVATVAEQTLAVGAVLIVI